MTDFTEFEVDLDTERPNPNDNTKVLRGDAPRTAFTKYNDMLAAVHQVVRHIGPLAPSPTVPWMLWVDTNYDPPIERERNGENTAWILAAVKSSVQVKGASGNINISLENESGTSGNFSQITVGTASGYWNLGTEGGGTGRFFLHNLTAGVDQVRLGGGANSGVYLAALGTAGITFATGNTDRLVILTNGNVGFGISAPTFNASYKGVHIHNPLGSQGTQLHLSNAATGGTDNDGASISSDAAGVMYLWNYENAPLTLATNSLARLTITSAGDVTSVSGVIGYGAGAGGTVNQATSKSTGVTLNKPAGRIVTTADSLAAGAVVSFTLTNGSITQYNTVAVTIASTVTPGGYLVTVDSVVNGSCRISIRNMTSGALADTLGLNFTVTRGSIS